MSLTILSRDNRRRATLDVTPRGVEVQFWKLIQAGDCGQRGINVALLDPCEVRGLWKQTDPPEVIDTSLPWHCVLDRACEVLG